MSQPIYVKREKADEPGQYEFVEVSADTVDPEAIRPLVVNHPDYRRVVSESIERKEKLRALTDAKTPAEGSSPKQEAPVAPPVIDEEALLEKLLAKQAAIQDAKDRAAADREAQITALLGEFKLGETARPLLAGAVDPRMMAQTLASGRYTFQNAPAAGNPGKGETVTDAEDLQRRLLKRLGLD
jgi:hypothetical protein